MSLVPPTTALSLVALGNRWCRIAGALAALTASALAGVVLNAGIVSVTAPARIEAAPVAQTEGEADRVQDTHPSREGSRRLAAPPPARATKATPDATTTTTAKPRPTTTTTTAPPPPPPPPLSLFATTEEREQAMFVTGQGWGNGTTPAHGLGDVVPGCQLLVPAVERFHQLLLEAAWAGHHFRINDCYRDLAGQHAMRWEWCVKGSCGNAAVPGYSSHGFGLAVDLGLPDRQLQPTDAAFAWLTEQGPRFGFRQPDWALPHGPIPEPWHWEYFGPVDRSW